MRIFLLITLGFVWGFSAQTFAQETVPFDASTDAEDRQTIAFVGEKIFVEERNIQETMEVTRPDGRTATRIIPNRDSRYEARYKILDQISGEYDRSEIDFVAFDHYGNPHFPKYDNVLLFITNVDGVWHHQKYLSYQVHATTDGDWAICGGPGGDDGIGISYIEPLGFVEPVKVRGSDEVCKSGTRVHNVSEYQNITRFLPERWRRQCNLEMGERENIFFLSGKTPESKEKKQIHDACMARLAFHAATNPAALSKAQSR